MLHRINLIRRVLMIIKELIKERTGDTGWASVTFERVNSDRDWKRGEMSFIKFIFGPLWPSVIKVINSSV